MTIDQNLKNITETRIRFSEVDSMGVVWHGNYVKYLEAFGKQYHLGYLDVYRHDIMTPVVELTINYKSYLIYGDEIIIETEFENTEAAKIIFNYKIYKKTDRSIVLTARSIQVFIDKARNLILTNPSFYHKWKKKLGLFVEEV